VSLKLIVDGQVIELGQVGPEFVRLREPMQGLEGKAAQLVIRVGSTRKIQEIILAQRSSTDPKSISYW
jgi:hypothetical protein